MTEKKKKSPTKSLKKEATTKTSEEEVPTVVKEEEKPVAEDKAAGVCLQIRSASKETCARAMKILSVEPVAFYERAKQIGAISSFSYSVLLVVDPVQYVVSVEGVLLDSVTRSPDAVVVYGREVIKALLATPKHRFLNLFGSIFDYVDLVNAIKIVRKDDDRYALHYFKADADACLLIQNSSLETVYAVAKQSDLVTGIPVGIDSIINQYNTEQNIARRKTISDFLDGEEGSGLDKWSDFGA